MKLISPSNNKTLVTPEKRQSYQGTQAPTLWHLRTLGEANKDETGRRLEEGKKKKRERNEKGKGRIKVGADRNERCEAIASKGHV